MRQRAAERPAVADLPVGHGRGGLRDEVGVLADQWVLQHLVMRRHRADHDGVAVLTHTAQLLDPGEIDDRRRRRQPQPHDRDERLATGEKLDVLAAGQRLQCLVHSGRTDVVERGGDHSALSWVSAVAEYAIDPSAARSPPDEPSRTARQTRSGVIGMSTSVTPR